MSGLVDLIKRLVEAVKRLLSLRCACMDEQAYNQLVKELQDVIAMLDSWYRQAVGGAIGEHKEADRHS